MPSKLFRDNADAQLDDALGAAHSDFTAKVSADVSGLAATENRSISSSADSAIERSASDEVQKRAEIIKDICSRVLTATEGETPEEVAQFAEARLLEEYQKIKELADAARPRLRGGFQRPFDFSRELRKSRETLVAGFDIPNALAGRNRGVDLFISHSSRDSDLALLLVKLFRTALRLGSEQVRCTSVDGYRLPAGAETDNQLRDEVLGARLLVGIMSSSSLASAFVLFELGARWGAKKRLVPLLGPGMRAGDLRGPVAGLNALSCEHHAQLHQLVTDSAEILGVTAEKPQTYQEQLDTIVYFATAQLSQWTTAERPQVNSPAVPQQEPGLGAELRVLLPTDASNEFTEAEETIRRHCEGEFPNDYYMQAYCVAQQRAAVVKLRAGRPDDVPVEVFGLMRRRCAAEWPSDYSMRVYCEKQQTDGYRELKGFRT
jgi:hypothetical protein